MQEKSNIVTLQKAAGNKKETICNNTVNVIFKAALIMFFWPFVVSVVFIACSTARRAALSLICSCAAGHQMNVGLKFFLRLALSSTTLSESLTFYPWVANVVCLQLEWRKQRLTTDETEPNHFLSAASHPKQSAERC